jgi:hypothetical protein
LADRKINKKVVSETLGAAAVVLSLVFVGFELRENALATKAEAAHNVSMALQTFYLELGTNVQAGSVFRRAMVDPESLSPDEAFQFIMAMHSGMLAYQDGFYLAQEGALDEYLNKVLSRALSAGRATPGFNWYWQQRRGYFTDEFQRFVDDLNPPAKLPPIYE